MLKKENQAVNWFLSGQRVSVEIPSDSIFEVGPEAPYYKMNEDGTLYMQVLNAGEQDKANRPKDGEKVYFRFSRRNLKMMMNGQDPAWEGNSDNLNSGVGATSFILGNQYLPSTTKYGEGLQKPLRYLGYYSEVNLIIKASEGFLEDQSSCIPYVYNVRYFKAEY
ncbi:MAG: DUF4827 domain-containing protein [Muribaculaceae bacterium]|nr:DUF4827 domain-containing protein [Muribaculaceae bacterium]